MKELLLCNLVIASLALPTEAAATCYYPDGSTTEPNHRPCNSTIATSACCDPLDSCTVTGLCLGRSGFTYRGSCTDNTWENPNCPSACHADPFNKLPYSAFTPLWPCDAPGGPSTDYCCNSPTRNCCTIATFKYGSTGVSFKGGMDQLILEASNNNDSTSDAPATVTLTATAAVGAASSTDAAVSSTPSLKSSSSGSSNLAPILGAAIGVPLGVLAVGLVSFLFWRTRRSANAQASPIEMNPSPRKAYPSSTSSEYYAPQPPQPPAPAPQPPTEVSYWPGQQLSRSDTRGTDRKSPGFNTGPAGVHELI